MTDQAEDADFFKTFAIVLAVLALLAVLFAVVAGIVSENSDPGREQLRNELAQQAIMDRLAPVATVVLAGASGAGGAAAAPRSGEEIVAFACAACHNAGVAEAPLTGDTAAWQVRYDLGMDQLMASVINGKGAMPPRAGHPTLSDDDIYNGIVELLALAKIEVTDSRPASTDAASAETAFDVTETDTVTEDAVETAAAEAPAGAPVAAADPAPAADNAALLAHGEQVYNRGCQNCHGMGIAGAPKLGDKAAWAPRIAQPENVIFQHVLRGFAGSSGFMPPKGGMPFLSDDDVIAASLYMIEMGK